MLARELLGPYKGKRRTVAWVIHQEIINSSRPLYSWTDQLKAHHCLGKSGGLMHPASQLQVPNSGHQSENGVPDVIFSCTYHVLYCRNALIIPAAP